MRWITKAGSSPLRPLAISVAMLATLLVAFASATPARSADYYERYDRPYRYNDVPQYRYAYWRPYRTRTNCYYCGCGWRCPAPVVNRRPVYRHGPDIIERRYIVREYVERRYEPWRARYHVRSYADDWDDVPRPPAPVPEQPASYDYDEE